MELLKKVTVARAVWYFVPGLLFLFYFFLPLAAFKYEETTRLIRDYGIGTLALLGLVIGFVLDGLRLYRLRPKYNQIKSEFLDQLRDTVGANLDPHYLFLGINEFAGRDREAGLDYKYTVWAVIGQFTFLTWCEAGIWFLSPIVLLIKGNQVCEFFGRIANAVRNKLSGESIKDVGCSLKAFRSVYAKKMKLYTGLHRFFPTLIKMEGGRVTEVAVNHRPRKYGTPKYNIRNRMVRSFIDLLAVCWMKKRILTYEIEE